MPEAVSTILRLVLAGVFGGIVGYEREVHEHPAGLRTHTLVCMGAALMTMVSVSFSSPGSDPGRIAAQIVSGIGFLGAGTILRQGNIVRGLTTAASLWTVAGIGIAVGVGGFLYLLLATAATAIVFITLSTMRSIEPSLGKRGKNNLYLEMSADELQALGRALQELASMGVLVQSIQCVEASSEDKRAFRLKVALSGRTKVEAVVDMLASLTGLDRFEWA